MKSISNARGIDIKGPGNEAESPEDSKSLNQRNKVDPKRNVLNYDIKTTQKKRGKILEASGPHNSNKAKRFPSYNKQNKFSNNTISSNNTNKFENKEDNKMTNSPSKGNGTISTLPNLTTTPLNVSPGRYSKQGAPLLLINCGRFTPAGKLQNEEHLISTRANERFTQVITDAILFKCNDRANNSIISRLSDDNIVKAMNKVTEGLQIIHQVDSIIKFRKSDSVDNFAMTGLQKKFRDPLIQNATILLKESLVNKPIPPKVHHMIKWLYQNYSSSPNNLSAIQKISYKSYLIDDLMTKDDVLKDIEDTLALLKDPVLKDTFSLISVHIPEWKIKESTLESSSGDVVYDEQFNMFFRNIPCFYKDASTPTAITEEVYPKVTQISDNLDYSIPFAESKVNDYAYALNEIYQESTTEPGKYVLRTGLFQSYSDWNAANTLLTCNKWAVTTTETSGEFNSFPLYLRLDTLLASANTYQVYKKSTSTVPEKYQSTPFGDTTALVHNGLKLESILNECLDKLYDYDMLIGN